jgi:O-antigen ligase
MDTMRLRNMLAGDGRKLARQPSRRAQHAVKRPWVLLGFLTLTFLIGGSSRADLPFLILLRPVAALVFTYAIATLPANRWRQDWKPILFAGLIVLVPLLQLIPLPPAIWQALNGRDLVVRIDRAAGLSDVWRPLSLSPAMTWNALFALCGPVAVLLLGLRLDLAQRRSLVPAVLTIIAASALLGLLQIIGPRGGGLYYYPITHIDSPVGFLANRNHQAAFVACVFPILGYLLTDPDARERFYGRPAFAIAIAIFALPFLLIVGSRAGLAVTGVAIFAGAVLYVVGALELGGKLDRKVFVTLGGGAVLLGGMMLLAIFLDRAEAFRRAVGWHSDNDFRLRAWAQIAGFMKDYWPWGTGMGSFVDVYKIYEPYEMLQPAYFNQAHNDWLEVCLTGGLFGAGLLLAGLVTWVLSAWAVRRPITGGQLRRLGLSVLLLFALASLTDYPLRVPSLANFAALAVLWALPVRTASSIEMRRSGVK